MNDEFWNRLASLAQARRSEAFWSAQRRRVFARLHGRSPRWLPVPALAAAAIFAGLVLWRRSARPPAPPAVVPAQQWEFLESIDMIDHLDVLRNARELDRS